jgi:hypothetical protein
VLARLYCLQRMPPAVAHRYLHTSAYVSIRAHTFAYVSLGCKGWREELVTTAGRGEGWSIPTLAPRIRLLEPSHQSPSHQRCLSQLAPRPHRQRATPTRIPTIHTSAYNPQRRPACLPYVTTRHHTSAYVSIRLVRRMPHALAGVCNML